VTRSREGLARVALIAGLLLGSTACSGLPESGPVVDADVDSVVDDERASDLNAVPPAVNASASEIVKGFLDAMTASPIRVDVARQFLSTAAAAEWDPEASTITYADKLPARAVSGTRVVVSLSDAELLDRSGAWQGELPDNRQELDFRLTIEGGEFRITNPLDALVVPAPWFTQRFRQASLYFFDPGGRVLAPQPVYVPRGDQLATSLIDGLLSGPASGARASVRSFIPSGLSAGLSVPVSPDGVADIDLGGDLGGQNPVATERMLAQFAWTLRQEPGITSLRVTVGGQPVRGPGGSPLYDVTEAQQYNPSGASASPDIYALVDGMLARREGNELQPTTGPFGTRKFGLRAVAVSLDAARAAAVSIDGRRLLIASTTGAEQPLRPITAGTDLLRPRWDLAGRVWVVDRTPSGAVVRYVADGRARVVDVPGVSGRQVSSFLVSRDGTRFVAVVRGEAEDELRIGPVLVDQRGRVDRVGPTTRLLADQATPSRVLDIAWSSPTSITVLTPIIDPEIFEARTVSVDGSQANAESFSTTVSEPLIGLTGSPAGDLVTLGVTATGLVDLSTGAVYGFVGPPPRSIGYAG